MVTLRHETRTRTLSAILRRHTMVLWEFQCYASITLARLVTIDLLCFRSFPEKRISGIVKQEQRGAQLPRENSFARCIVIPNYLFGDSLSSHLDATCNSTIRHRLTFSLSLQPMSCSNCMFWCQPFLSHLWLYIRSPAITRRYSTGSFLWYTEMFATYYNLHPVHPILRVLLVCIFIKWTFKNRLMKKIRRKFVYSADLLYLCTKE